MTPPLDAPATRPGDATSGRTTLRARAGTALRLLELALVVAVALLLLLELGARLLAPSPPGTPWVPHPFFQIARPQSYRPQRIDIDEPSRRFAFETNPFGLRGKSITTQKKPDGAYRIFFVGGSTT